MEKDQGVQQIVDAINASKDPEKVFNALILILSAMKKGTNNGQHAEAET